MPSQDAMTRISTQAISSPKSPSTRKRRTPRGPAWAAYPSDTSVPRAHCSKLRKTNPPITTIQNSHHGAFTGLPPDRTIRCSNGLTRGSLTWRMPRAKPPNGLSFLAFTAQCVRATTAAPRQTTATRSRAIWMTSIIDEYDGLLLRRATHREAPAPATNQCAGYGVGPLMQAGILENVVGSLAAG